jgi:predicted nucleotidyltransferase
MPEAQLAKILQSLRLGLAQALGDQLESVILFGSQARGEARADSDIDVLVIVRDEADYGELIQRTSALVSTLSLEYGVVISRAFASKSRFDRERSPFILNVRREGVTL